MQTAVLHEIPAAPVPVPQALDRDARTAPLLGLGPEATSSFHGTDLVFIGAGSVGGTAIDRAARSAPRSLFVVDPGRFKAESLLHHDVAPEMLGRPKARVAAERAKGVSPQTRVGFLEAPVQKLPLRVVAGASHVVLATDNLAAELWVFRCALELGVPVIQASVYGPTLTAQIRSIQPSPGSEGPCGGCPWTAAEWDALDAGTRFSCSGDGHGAGGDPVPLASGVPTRAPASLCGVAGNLAVLEVIRHAAGIGRESRLVDYCGWNHSIHVSPLVRRAACPLPHARSVLELRDDLGRATPRSLLGEAGLAECDPQRLTLSVEARRYAGRGLCAECGAEAAVGRFAPDAALEERCPCGSALAPHPLDFHEEVPWMALEPHLDRPFAALGVPAPESVRLRSDDRAVRFLARPPQHACAEAQR